VVGGNQHGGDARREQSGTHNVRHHWPAGQLQERLAGQSRGAEARRNHGDSHALIGAKIHSREER
jgi:hypothetical protein